MYVYNYLCCVVRSIIINSFDRLYFHWTSQVFAWIYPKRWTNVYHCSLNNSYVCIISCMLICVSFRNMYSNNVAQCRYILTGNDFSNHTIMCISLYEPTYNTKILHNIVTHVCIYACDTKSYKQTLYNKKKFFSFVTLM